MYRAALYSGCAGEDVPGGFVLTLAGECPLFSAWGRFEDGAPAPHEHFRRCEVPTPRMGRHRGWSPAPRECLRCGRFRTANDEL